MVKHFCDICGKEISGISCVNDVTLLTGLIEAQFNTLPTQKDGCEICISCANTIMRTIDMMKRGKEVIYK